jgi:hypothetical protein
LVEWVGVEGGDDRDIRRVEELVGELGG